jgi:hypothetical protein
VGASVSLKIAVDHGLAVAVGHIMPAATRRIAAISAGAQTSRPLVSWSWATRIATVDPANLVVLTPP